jgi:Rrf2 family protein
MRHALEALRMKLSRTIAYALFATVRLAQGEPGVPIPCSQLARECGFPERFLLTVLRELVYSGILRSVRGVDGGYYLGRPPTQITLLDIIECFESPLESNFPVHAEFPYYAQVRICLTLNQASRAACQELHKLSIAELAFSSDVLETK